MAATAALLVMPPGPDSAAAADAPVSAERPNARLFSLVSDNARIRAINKMGVAERAAALNDVQNWFVHLETNGVPMGEPTRGSSPETVAETLSKDGMLISFYRNGSSTTTKDEPLSSKRPRR